jgi:hypothetical protein
VEEQAVTRPDQVFRHRAPHDAKADETDIHVALRER